MLNPNIKINFPGITKQYILKCENDLQLQKKWSPKPGDLFYANTEVKICCDVSLNEISLKVFESNSNKIITYHRNNIIFTCHRNKTICTWLPTQNQLQKIALLKLENMIRKSYHIEKEQPLNETCTREIVYQLLCEFNHWLFSATNKRNNFYSIEEAWLSYIMWQDLNEEV